MSTVHKVMQLWRPGQYIKPHDAGPRIGHLFGAGQQGGVYLFDKSHQASAFQGGAYDTPLSAVEQFIGSFYDLSGNANHCSQTTSTARGKWSARVNLSSDSEDMGAWVGASSPGFTVVSANSEIAPNGTLTADVINLAGPGSYAYRPVNGYAAVAGNSISITIYCKTANRIIGFGGSTVSGTDVYSVVALPDGWFRQKVKRTFTVTATGLIQLIPVSFAWGAGAGNHTVWGIDFRPSTLDYLPYQSVNTAADYDTAGFPPYLRPDGADDYYTSASGGGSTTGIFICAAIAPWAAGAKQVIWSDASGNTGYELCINASNQVEFSAGTGSARVSCVSAALSLGAPKVITAQHDGTNLTVRVDGVATTAACGAASAGTAGTTLLRANGAASSYAKVQINGLVQRHGAQPSAEQLTFAERHMANLQGRTL